jgi:exopolyphosphatase/pppGpp-phosphohydrolase
MHDVGRARGTKNHQKKSYKMIRKLQRPLGWSARELELAAMVARYHRGALPLPRAKVVQRIELPDRPIATLLAGILRLSVALGMQVGRNGQKRAKNRRASDVSQMSAAHQAPHLEVQAQDSFITVRAEGYSSLDRSAECVAAARHLLETVLRRPVVVRALRASGAGDVRTRPLRKTQGAGHPPRSTILVSDLVAS